MTQDNNQFSTQDINLATFLCAKGVTLQEIRASSEKFHCSFADTEVTSSIANNASASATITITMYTVADE